VRASFQLTLLCVAAIFWLLPARPARADALRNVDRAASGGGGGTDRSSSSSSTRSRGSSSSSSGSRWESDSSDDGDSFMALLMLYTVTSPWTVPRAFDDRALVGYAPHPFYRGAGVLRLAEGSNPETDAQGVRNVALAVDVESGYLIQGVVPAGIALRLALPHRFEIDTRVNLLTDILEIPSQLAALGTSHVSYRFAQGKRFDFRTGLGMRVFTLDSVRLGVDVMYAVDSYIAENVALRIELHVGNLSQAFVGQARTTLGVMFGRTEVYAGYDHTSYISEASTARLGGPIVGVRSWF
jgi:hypothetical protein